MGSGAESFADPTVLAGDKVQNWPVGLVTPLHHSLFHSLFPWFLLFLLFLIFKYFLLEIACRRALAFLSFLDEKGEELCLHKLLYEPAVGLGGQSLAEGPFLETALSIGFPFDIGSIVTHSLDKELHERT